ncbi:MAG: helix-turn-helix transcriptional regulator [Armatimonadetes bacterium]|nr:transcriptional regulator [Armatimonadota bacterium]NOG92488.1 helix-turn-helix transcriptional regulator [Armatimonadota bacterium]
MQKAAGDQKAASIEKIRCDAYNDDPLRVARVAMRMEPRETLERAGRTLSALGHPVRATIFHAISIEPLCVCELGALLGMSSPALMHHLKIMGRAGLIEARKEGKFAVYQPADAPARKALDAALQLEPALIGGTR